MEESNEMVQLRRIAAEAIEMLEDVKHKFGLFEAQRFGKIKGKFANYNKLSNQLSSGLSAIETSDQFKQ
ncbi:MAG: hypothetical protein JWP67_1808 [Mucilaginibacter sp.]|jgi:hypothetical protein|nr:hypothetical protein [Mucilaginibacter sp.]